MPTIQPIRAMLCFTAAVLLLQATVVADSDISARGITLPSKIIERAFMTPGTVKEALVKDGETVTAGQLLFVLDDALEVAGLDILNLQANSTIRVEAAREELNMRQVRLDRVERLNREGNVSPTELEEARLAVVIAELQVRAAEEESTEKRLQVQRQQVVLERMRLTSPIDGVVERITASEGQLVDPSRPSCVVLQIDPLWVEIRHLRADQIAHLQTGQTVQVRHGNEEWSDARIIFISAMGDPATGTQLVRLELPNPGRRASGQEVLVQVPAPGGMPHAQAERN